MTLAQYDLRRHVLDGATEGVGPLLRLCRQELPTQAKVCQRDVTILVEQDVLQLDVAVDDSVLEEEARINGSGDSI